MTEVNVRQADVVIRTVKVTKALLKQVTKMTWAEHAHCYTKAGLKPELVIGWIHGSVLGDEYSKYALVNLGDGDLGLAELGMNEHKPFRQLYIA